MKSPRIPKSKYLLMAVLLIALFALSGCRTRITNNSEVSNIHYDQDGFLTETYQMRRDELGLSTAEKPILPNFGTNESDEEFDNTEDETALENYEPEVEEPYVEPPQTTTNNTTTTTTRPGTTTRPTTTPNRYVRPVRPGTPTNNTKDEITVTFSPGKEGKISGKEKGKSETKKVKKNATVTPPSDVKRDGYTLTGWKRKSDGKTLAKSFSVVVSKNETFTAVWGPEDSGNNNSGEETAKKKYTVRFLDENGKELKKEDVEEGKAATAPTITERAGYSYSWDKDFSRITKALDVKLIWTENEKVYKVKLNYGEEGYEDQDIEIHGDKYENLPVLSRKGYPDAKWVDSNGKQIQNGDKISADGDHNLTVDWGTYNANNFWSKDYDEKVPKEKDRIKYSIITTVDGLDPGDAEKIGDDTSLVETIIGNAGSKKTNESDADYLVLYSKDAANAEELATKVSDKTGKHVIAINAKETELKDNIKLLYKILAFNKLYDGANTEEEIKKAVEELGGKKEDLVVVIK